MRKCILLTAVLMFLAGPALAAIANTKHDLSTTSTAYGAGGGSDSDKICVFCHTPHFAGASGFAPLWNRTNDTAVTTVYGNPSGSMDSTATVAGANSTDAPLCLSCHDGTIGTALTNPPNAGAPTAIAATVAAAAQIGADLSNDHPIAISYAIVDAADTEIVAVGSLPAAINLYNVDSDGDLTADFADGLWCSSCHDVHDNTNAPFLVISNAASGLCTTCHIK